MFQAWKAFPGLPSIFNCSRCEGQERQRQSSLCILSRATARWIPNPRLWWWRWPMSLLRLVKSMKWRSQRICNQWVLMKKWRVCVTAAQTSWRCRFTKTAAMPTESLPTALDIDSRKLRLSICEKCERLRINYGINMWRNSLDWTFPGASWCPMSMWQHCCDWPLCVNKWKLICENYIH